MLWRLTARSVVANRGRSLFVVLALGLLSLSLVLGGAIVSSIRSNIELGLRQGFAGDLQVFSDGNPPLRLTSEVPVEFLPIERPDEVVRVLMDDPAVVGVGRRSNASGLVLADGFEAPVILVGIEPREETETLAWLEPESRGAGWEADSILLGTPMAERLRAEPGDQVTVLVPTADGLMDGDLFEVRGTYSPPGLPLIDEFVAFVPVGLLQSILAEEGQPRSLVVRLRQGSDPRAVRDRLRRSLEGAGLAVEAWTWDELAGDLLGMARVGRTLVGIGYLLVLLVVTLGVANTVLILMLEKTREIGLMRALGTPRWRIVSALVTEVTLIAAISSAIGTAVGVALCALLGRLGIPATSRAMTYAFGGDHLFLQIGGTQVLLAFLVVAVVGPFAALWPAVRASAADPARVMRSPV